MGLSLFVNGEKVNFKLTEHEVRAYDFIYSAPNSKKSKAAEDERYLKITGDISRIIEKNNAVLELIRKWAKSEYTDDTYFNHVKITETYNDMRWKDNIAASYHQNNTVNDEPNRKYVSFDGHFELVFNGDNALQTQYNNSDDMGTYNYYDPDADGVGHAIYDVEPYGLIPGMIKWGNVPNI